MNAEQVLNPFFRLLDRTGDTLREWKKRNGRKILGCLPMYIPEELIFAAGILPVPLIGHDETITLANNHLMVHTCHIVRSSYDAALKGAYDYLDGVVNPLTCDQLRFFADVWFADTAFDYTLPLWLPYKQDESAGDFLRRELLAFKTRLEEIAGVQMTAKMIRDSFSLYNKNRSLIGTLCRSRGEKTFPLTASQVARVVTANMLLPKDESNVYLEQLIDWLAGQTQERSGAVRLLAIGHPCSPPEAGVLDLLESLGSVVVGDDFYFGYRYALASLTEGVDPIESLTERYLNMVPCVTKHRTGDYLKEKGAGTDGYLDFVLRLYKESEAKGIVIIREDYCDPYDFEYPILARGLDEQGVPFYAITTEHRKASLEQMRTRLQAFIEMVKG